MTSKNLQSFLVGREVGGPNVNQNFHCAAFDDDGNYFAGGRADGSILLVDYHSRKNWSLRSNRHTQAITAVSFQPQTSAQVLISTGSDRSLVVMDPIEMKFLRAYDCLGARVRRIAHENSPHVFYTGSDEGCVRMFDLREQHACDGSGCRKSVLIDLRRERTRQLRLTTGQMLTSRSMALTDILGLDVNPVDANQIAVGCNDPYVRIFDRRLLTMAPSTNEPTKPFYRFLPGIISSNNNHSLSNVFVSDVRYNHDGTQLLACYNGHGLFTLNTKQLLDRSRFAAKKRKEATEEAQPPKEKRSRRRGRAPSDPDAMDVDGQTASSPQSGVYGSSRDDEDNEDDDEDGTNTPLGRPSRRQVSKRRRTENSLDTLADTTETLVSHSPAQSPAIPLAASEAGSQRTTVSSAPVGMANDITSDAESLVFPTRPPAPTMPANLMMNLFPFMTGMPDMLSLMNAGVGGMNRNAPPSPTPGTTTTIPHIAIRTVPIRLGIPAPNQPAQPTEGTTAGSPAASPTNNFLPQALRQFMGTLVGAGNADGGRVAPSQGEPPSQGAENAANPNEPPAGAQMLQQLLQEISEAILREATSRQLDSTTASPAAPTQARQEPEPTPSSSSYSSSSDVEDPTFIKHFQGHLHFENEQKDCIFMGPKSQFVVTGSEEGSLFVWNAATADIVAIITRGGTTDNLTVLTAPRRQTRLVTIGSKNFLSVWTPCRSSDDIIEASPSDPFPAKTASTLERTNICNRNISYMRENAATRRGRPRVNVDIVRFEGDIHQSNEDERDTPSPPAASDNNPPAAGNPSGPAAPPAQGRGNGNTGPRQCVIQ